MTRPTVHEAVANAHLAVGECALTLNRISNAVDKPEIRGRLNTDMVDFARNWLSLSIAVEVLNDSTRREKESNLAHEPIFVLPSFEKEKPGARKQIGLVILAIVVSLCLYSIWWSLV